MVYERYRQAGVLSFDGFIFARKPLEHGPRAFFVMARFGVIEIELLDKILARYGSILFELGTQKTHKIIARAMNYEGKKTYTKVKRAIRAQSSIPYSLISAGTRFRRASTKGGALETAIVGRGDHLLLKHFRPRQHSYGASAFVWAHRKQYRSAFAAPGDNPKLVAKLGTPFRRVGKPRYPIVALHGPNLAVEMVRDLPPKIFLADSNKIADRVAKEIAAVLRGY